MADEFQEVMLTVEADWSGLGGGGGEERGHGEEGHLMRGERWKDTLRLDEINYGKYHREGFSERRHLMMWRRETSEKLG